MSGDRDERPRRTTAETWCPEIPPEDTAPTLDPPKPDVETWGRTQEEAQQMLRRQMCPICGKGPWVSPLNHAAKKHGIDRFAMREACGMNTVESVADPDYSARIAERTRKLDMSTVNHKGRPRRKQRFTSAGRATVSANLVTWEAENPEEALAMRAKAGRAGAAARWGQGK